MKKDSQTYKTGSNNDETKNNNQIITLTSSEKILAVLLGFGLILGFLLTPLGVETRMNEIRTLLFAGFFITAGLLLPIAGLLLIWLQKPKFASVLAIIDASLLILTAPADQSLFFFTVSPPAAVTVGEYFLIILGIGYVIYGTRTYDKYSTK